MQHTHKNVGIVSYFEKKNASAVSNLWLFHFLDKYFKMYRCTGITIKSGQKRLKWHQEIYDRADPSAVHQVYNFRGKKKDKTDHNTDKICVNNL